MNSIDSIICQRWFVVLCALLSALNEVGTQAAEPGPATKPTYQVVHGWPKLAEGFMLGHVSGIAVDSHNHVFVFHRGTHSVLGSNYVSTAEQPLILCFDGASGRQVSAWGENL